MKPYLTLFLGSIGLFFYIQAQAQVYHFETGKVVPIETSGQIIWRDGVYDNYSARFGTLVVKENRLNPQSRLIQVPVIHIMALKPDSTQFPIFILNGGPGESNINTNLLFDQLIQNHDIVLVGYRGVDGLVKLDCPCLLNALNSVDLNASNATTKYYKAIDTCLVNWEKQQIDLVGYSIQEVVNDMEEVRLLMRYSKISFVSFSYGAMITELYQQQYAGNCVNNIYIAPRPLGQFAIVPDDLTFLSDQINMYFGEVIDVDHRLFRSYFSAFDTLMICYPQLNRQRFMIYLFSKLYSISGIQELQVSLKKGKLGNWHPFIEDYELFYKTYGKKLVLGDMIIKKQAFALEPNNLADTNRIYNDLIEPVNQWFNHHVEIKNLKRDIVNPFVVDSTQSLIICGEFELVSAPAKVQKYYQQIFPNVTFVTLTHAGHLDYFQDKKGEVEIVIKDFFDKVK